MEFITVEQFKEQSKEVQKVFLDWWNESRYDLVCLEWDATKELVNEMGINLEIGIKNKISTYEEIIIYLNNLECLGIENKELIPLFTEGQLRKFIEDKLEQIHYENDGRKIELDITHNNGFTRILEGVYGSAKGVKRVEWIIEDGWGKRYDLLKAYWKVACMIAEEEVDG